MFFDYGNPQVVIFGLIAFPSWEFNDQPLDYPITDSESITGTTSNSTNTITGSLAEPGA